MPVALSGAPKVPPTSHRIWTNPEAGPWVKWGTHFPIPFVITQLIYTQSDHYFTRDA